MAPHKRLRVLCLQVGHVSAEGGRRYANWCFLGNFKRFDGNRVEFYDVNRKTTAQSAFQNTDNDETAQGTPPPPVAPIHVPSSPALAPGDGVLLVNSEKNGLWTSGLVWYRKIGEGDDRRPDAYMDIKTDGTVEWESNFQGGKKTPVSYRYGRIVSHISRRQQVLGGGRSQP